MTTIELNGYIDDESWWGDEITPDSLNAQLTANPGDILIRLNSYGGSCNAATRMYDMLREHPGNVTVRISGAACSAGSVLAMAGKTIEMTPGSLLMYHNPSTIAWGEERNLQEAIDLLRATKESILNIYVRRTGLDRAELAAGMDKTTWLDAEAALEAGFIDRIAGDAPEGKPENSGAARRTIDQRDAEEKVREWVKRRTCAGERSATPPPDKPPENREDPEPPEPKSGQGVFVANRYRLLILEG